MVRTCRLVEDRTGRAGAGLVVGENAHDVRVAAVTAEVTRSCRGVTQLLDAVVSLDEGGVEVHVGHRVPRH